MLGSFRIAWIAAILCIALAVIACDAKGNEKATGNPPSSGSGPISASPNPCKITGGTACATVVTWNAGTGTDAEVTVQDTTGP
jgi:hypothetical protein